jgi:hypothetical protein
MRKKIGRVPFLLLAACAAIVLGVPHVHAQGSTGFVKIATGVAALTYVDASCPAGATCAYEVTAVNPGPGIESLPDPDTTPLVECAIPATGTHTCTLTWTASATAGATYNVYQASALPPGGLAAAEK